MNEQRKYIKPDIETVDIFPRKAYAQGLTPNQRARLKELRRQARLDRLFQNLARRRFI